MNAENVGEILDALAVRFGSTGAHLWAVLQRQAYVEVASAAYCVLVVAALIPLGFWFLRRGGAVADNPKTPADAEVPWYVGGTITLIAGGIVALVAVFQIQSAIAAVMNPEFYALSLVLGAFK